MLLTCNPDIVCIVESWLSDDIQDNEISLPNYSVVRLDRNRHGGGIVMYIKNTFTYSNVLLGPSDLELIFLCLGTFYRPPSSSVFIFDTLFDVLRSLGMSLFSNFVLLGDFNVDVLSNSYLCNHLNNILYSFHLTQVMTEPTHAKPDGTSSLIDLVLMSVPESLSECVTVPPLANSDHLGVSLCINYRMCSKKNSCRKRRTIWRYEHADFSKACEMLDQMDPTNIFSEPSIDLCWARWKESFLYVMSKCIPMATLPEKHSVPWMTKGIVQTIRKRNYYYRKYKHSQSHYHQNHYKKLRNKVITMLRQSKQKFFKTLHPNSNKAFWKAVNSLNKKDSVIPTLTFGGYAATTNREKAEVLNDHFTRCFNYAVQPLQPSRSYISSGNETPEDFLCTEDEVFHLLSSVDPTKAAGPDRLSARMLKHTATSITSAITTLFNMSITSGKIPCEWKTAQVVPIPKSQQKADPSNYRPISLLPILSKLLEKHIHACLLEHLEVHSPISEKQWGFLKGKSTTGVLLTAIDGWHQALEMGEDVCSVFLDLSKAFDKVPHIPLLSKLAHLNVPKTLFDWLHNYLCQRLQYVVVNGESSASTCVISGVPQGSVLGPLLFLIYINGLTQIPLNNGTHLLLYADDILIYRRIQTQMDYHLLQQDVGALETWLLQNHLQMNASKCKYMTISRKRSPPSHYQLCIENQPIEKVSTFKYLGVWLSDNLSWSTHVEKSSKNALKKSGLIYRRFSRYSSKDCLQQLYLSFVRPHLEYAVPVWDPHCLSHVNTLERVQKFSLRMIHRAWKEDYDVLLQKSGLQSLSDRRKYLKLCYLFQVMHGHFSCPITPENRDFNRRLRGINPYHLCQPFARTSSYKFSFFPHTISLWNSLPIDSLSCESLPAFKKCIMKLPHL